MRTLSVKVPAGFDAKLAAIARRRKTSKSMVVRAALEGLVTGRGRPRTGSALELARDLAGCVAGATDLSTNRGHFKTFGR